MAFREVISVTFEKVRMKHNLWTNSGVFCGRFQTCVAVYMRPSLFWVVMRSRKEGGSRRFGTVYWSHCQEVKDFLALEERADIPSRKNQ
jgi:hypothetical protein